MKIKRTERGWVGHFCCADRCLFRRNTLLEYGDVRIVISTVGLLIDKPTRNGYKFKTVGTNHYFETMAFHARREADRYWDADVSRLILFDSPGRINKLDADDKANDMHEAIVDEITKGLESGKGYL
jgi:hypothetical protein